LTVRRRKRRPAQTDAPSRFVRGFRGGLRHPQAECFQCAQGENKSGAGFSQALGKGTLFHAAHKSTAEGGINEGTETIGRRKRRFRGKCGARVKSSRKDGGRVKKRRSTEAGSAGVGGAGVGGQAFFSGQQPVCSEALPELGVGDFVCPEWHSSDLGQDVLGLCRPNRGLRFLVVWEKILLQRGDQLRQAVEDPTPQG
jgi:hypothetical protein